MKIITEEEMLYEYIKANKKRLPEEVKDDEKNFIEIVEYLLYYYENKEEYEKCSTLSKVLDNWEKMKMKKK
tara:strand:+ start:1560 stop:1772 length:213 start_codon:yes stop_codon:yes gene_type:complete